MSRRPLLTTAACCVAALGAAAPAAQARLGGGFPHYRGAIPTREGHVTGRLDITRFMASGPLVVAVEHMTGRVVDRRYPVPGSGADSAEAEVTVHRGSCTSLPLRIAGGRPKIDGIPAHVPTLNLRLRPRTPSARRLFCRVAKLAAVHLPPLNVAPPANGNDNATADAAQAPPPPPPGMTPTPQPANPVLAARRRLWVKHAAALAPLLDRILHLYG